MEVTSYAIALGSNQRHPRWGAPERVLVAATDALDVPVLARSRIIRSRPLGPSRRMYANATVVVETAMEPPELLEHLHAIEAAFGRRRRGGRWGSRVLDLDIVLWSAGAWADETMAIPHVRFRGRRFVLGPLAEIAPNWRDPVTGKTIRQLTACLDRRRPHP